ncbi:MAG: hypothetical protein D6820_00505, partial [Lentisphaerae bacterium]
CGALAGFPQISNYGGAQYLLASPWVDFFQSPYHYYNRSFPGVHYSQHAPDSILLHGKLFIDQLDTKTHLKRDDQDNTNARTPWETEQVLKRDVAHSIMKNTYCYWMEIYHGVFGGFGAPHNWQPMDFDDPAIRQQIAQLSKLCDEFASLNTEPVTEVAWFASKESCYHMRPDYLFERFFVDAQRQWMLCDAGAPFDDFVFEDIEAVERDYKVMIIPNANYMTTRQRRAIRRRIEEGATAIFFYAPGYVDEHGASLANIRELTELNLRYEERRDWLHVQLTAADHALLNGVKETDFGTNIRPEVLNRTQEWLKFPGNPVDDYRFNPVFFVDDDDCEVLGELTDFHLTHPAKGNA